MGGGRIPNGSTQNVRAAARLRPLAGQLVTILPCITASADDSSDRTRSVLQAFQSSQSPDPVEIINGPRNGAAANFLFLARREDLASDHYAVCDQGDVWETDKLERARLAAACWDFRTGADQQATEA